VSKMPAKNHGLHPNGILKNCFQEGQNSEGMGKVKRNLSRVLLKDLRNIFQKPMGNVGSGMEHEGSANMGRSICFTSKRGAMRLLHIGFPSTSTKGLIRVKSASATPATIRNALIQIICGWGRFLKISSICIKRKGVINTTSQFRLNAQSDTPLLKRTHFIISTTQGGRVAEFAIGHT